MQLRLTYSPTAENAPKFAADIIAPAARICGVDLDFSVLSLEAVDSIIEGFREEGCPSDEIAETLFGFGCYVGEILVRHAGGKWRNANEVEAAACITHFPLIIEFSESKFCNPIGKVFKRLENGGEDSLPYFYHVFAGQPKTG